MGMRRLLPRSAKTIAICSSVWYIGSLVGSIATRTTGFVIMNGENTQPILRPQTSHTFATESNDASSGQRANGNDSSTPRDTAKRTKKHVPKKKKYRPGMNSYLKVVLDDDTMFRLHRSAVQLQTEVEKLAKPDKQTIAEETSIALNGEDEPRRKQRKPLTFKPRSRGSLHLTFFFGGEALCELPEEDLSKWHNAVSCRLSESNFEVRTSTRDCELDSSLYDNSAPDGIQHESRADTEPNKGDFLLSLDKFSLFPPRKNYLIVALLDSSPAFRTLYGDLQEIARDVDSELLTSLLERSKKGERWTPHITLGNLQGGTKQDLQALRELLETFPVFSTSDASGEDSSATRIEMITMGGPIPKQLSLDWDFLYKPT